VNAGGSAADAEITLNGAISAGQRAKVILLSGANTTAANSFDKPANVAPAESEIENVPGHFQHTFPALSMTVLRVPFK
jgi:alpha-L-arabinofuranosidase